MQLAIKASTPWDPFDIWLVRKRNNGNPLIGIFTSSVRSDYIRIPCGFSWALRLSKDGH